MRILLIGEYSRLHLTLSEGLRELGHEVTLASDGDGFKNYERDIDLTRKSSGLKDTLVSLVSVLNKFSKFKGYDIVQLINPRFTSLNVRVNDYLFSQLKKHNRKVFLGAFGEDYFWVKTCTEGNTFKYSEFFTDGKPTAISGTEKLKAVWMNTRLETSNRLMAEQSDGIAACLYEYYMSYVPYFRRKTAYIPLPMNTKLVEVNRITDIPKKINFFIGINKERSCIKGTDIMEKILRQLVDKYPNKAAMLWTEDVSYEEYKKRMSESHLVLDQLYSYTPAMNALLAMAKGKVVVGGGEPEMYELLRENELKPIVNVTPNEQDIFDRLEHLILHPELISPLSEQSRIFVEKHHDYRKVAQQYIDFWER